MFMMKNSRIATMNIRNFLKCTTFKNMHFNVNFLESFMIRVKYFLFSETNVRKNPSTDGWLYLKSFKFILTKRLKTKYTTHEKTSFIRHLNYFKLPAVKVLSFLLANLTKLLRLLC